MRLLLLPKTYLYFDKNGSWFIVKKKKLHTNTKKKEKIVELHQPQIAISNLTICSLGIFSITPLHITHIQFT